ncbi:MAG: hypothetical protein J7K87_04030 [Candidatus Aenigmarchaeota archaeon]|nr:hypothetical protein [Candidatus Aenigmarchaeota archaeon]
MPVIGMEIRSIEAKRDEEVKGNLKINTTPTIKSLKERKINSINKNVIGIEFEYLCTYENPEKKSPEVGKIKIGGELLFLTENVDKVVKEWKKNKKVPVSVGIPAMNAILRKCLIRAIDISEELGLPPPIRFPEARPSSPDRKYI